MRPYELIKKKRDGIPLSTEEIASLITGFTRGEVPDYQMAAMAMAVFFRGLDDRELAAWTRAMLESGEVLDLSDIPGVKVDKHSTGGVGDKVSICLAPLAAACGVRVPMISGRGLGHTGGTLDKLESIPGFKVDLPVARYRELVRSVGTCLIGQTATLAPADKKLYALRDVTATVDCIPLIASSIMSKKLAEGIDALVLDVKVGSGAFMKTLPEARGLARTMVRIGAEMGKRVVALLTDMSQPLGRTVGNALEVKEAVAVLQGEAPADLTECTLALCGEMLVLAGLAKTASEAETLLAGRIRDGSAFEKLCEIATAQGGEARALRDLSRLPSARTIARVTSLSDGFVTAIDAEAVGLSAMALGAGRERVDGTIDPAVGIVLEKKVGDRVARDEPLALLHVNDDARAPEVIRRVRAAYRVEEAAAPAFPFVHERIDA